MVNVLAILSVIPEEVITLSAVIPVVSITLSLEGAMWTNAKDHRASMGFGPMIVQVMTAVLVDQGQLAPPIVPTRHAVKIMAVVQGFVTIVPPVSFAIPLPGLVLLPIIQLHHHQNVTLRYSVPAKNVEIMVVAELVPPVALLTKPVTNQPANVSG